MVALKPEWQLHQAIVDAGLSTLLGGGWKTLTFSGFKEGLVSAWKLRGMYNATNAAKEVSETARDAAVRKFGDKLFDKFKEYAVKVAPGEVSAVSQAGGILHYLTVNGLKDLQNAKTRTLIAVTEDRRRSVEFSTGADDSWIASHQEIYLAKRGTLRMPDSTNDLTYLWRKVKNGQQCLTRYKPAYISLSGVTTGSCGQGSQVWKVNQPGPYGREEPRTPFDRTDGSVSSGDVCLAAKKLDNVGNGKNEAGEVSFQHCDEKEAVRGRGQHWEISPDGRVMNSLLGEDFGCLYRNGNVYQSRKGKTFYSVAVKSCKDLTPNFKWELEKAYPYPYPWAEGSPYK
ncbi:hypothetical protein GO001_34015 [Streptomyces sp. NRRL B-1677]|uniref:hypothetical protein n=1 Tax=Streptomyces sp. NRRL B-1677 TaxID=2682966 RepID=UPI001892D241|nr:hypothetical protein [Streptomyces sp. NRRL B-1677]MBF6050132.1 hypothetical protein [Streptomyces sp. NRRL B-1677]